MKQSTREYTAIAACVGTFIVCAVAGPALSDGEVSTFADFIILTGTVTLSALAYMGVMRL